MREVATRAGVSVATVSYVVNGRDGLVGAETRERVLAAVQELGYVPSSSARGLRTQRTERVCLVVGSIGVPTYDEMARELHAAADRTGYGVIVLVADSAARAAHAHALLRRGIADGALIWTERFLPALDLDSLVRSRLAMTVIDNSVVPKGFDVVRIPERHACGEALDHMITSGRRRVAFVGHRTGREPDGEAHERYVAYLDALARHGLARDEALIVAGADDRVAGYRAVEALLRLPEPPDAVFATSDRAAISAMWAIRDSGRSVPGDVAVVGVGNLPEGQVVKPALSTAGQPHLDYSGVVRLLFDRLTADHLPAERELVLPWSFIRRESA
ncbi:LacI family DNA-binding transcriptional regulator [Streptomyces acidicola]|uniref:LacI family DNA-binding transcriptional regulator n=1 Tax=Streptomyces acidicola TaxID=2596892 RepID=UPI00342CFCCD